MDGIFESLNITRDHRMDNYPLLTSSWQLLGIFALYLYGIYAYLPSYMADRKPYNLTWTIRAYNIFQVIVCSVIIYGISTSGWTTHYTFGCQLIDPPDHPLGIRMANFLWLAYLVRIAELSETVFFILRKKYNQVSTLHVYHHISTIMVGWFSTKVYPGGMFTLSVMLNNFVHVLMYTYYFLASFGPDMQKRLEIVKSKLTTIQLIQLVIMLVHTSQAFMPGCKAATAIAYFAGCDLIILIMFFLNFYSKSYRKKNK